MPDFSALTDYMAGLDLSDPKSYMQSIFELDGQCNVVLQGKIGQVIKVTGVRSFWK